MLGIATVVFLGAVGMLTMAYFNRAEKGLPFIGERESISQSLVLVFGIGIPLVVLIGLFGVSDVWLVRKTAPPRPR